MRLLLDTHAFAWFILGDSRLSAYARTAIEDPRASVELSIASIWEMAIKAGLGKWPEADPLIADIEERLAKTGFAPLPISIAHVRAAGLMQTPHRDPFDRLIAAQASIEGLTIVTADAKLASLGAPVLW